jgi:DNA-binding LytR/AlgR family response regulator
MKALIIEDENLIARQLAGKLAHLAPDIEVQQILPSLKQARKWLTENAEPDLMFMDIQLSDGVSFELFETFDLKCPIIFVTAFDEYAIRAFKVNGIDYLLKPLEDENLAAALEKFRRLQQAPVSPAPGNWNQLLEAMMQKSTKPLYKEKFIIHQRNQWIPVNTADIAYIFRDNLIYFFTIGGEKLVYDTSTLDEIEELLDPSVFFRSNRQSIININMILKIKSLDNAKLLVYLKAPYSNVEFDISRDKAPTFRKWFDR